MSNTSPTAVPDTTDFDFWEFVCCAKCRMPFALENGSATIPFWLTACGHVVCNNHLNRDQSCSQCGAQDIHLAPLQREMEGHVSDWFRSIPTAFDSIAVALKFQQETMASEVRYHKTRHQQLRQLVERLKRDMSELKRSNDILQGQNEQYRRQMGDLDSGEDPSHLLNSNGKRQMNAMQQFEQAIRRSRTDSSPHSITTPLRPDRLTLLPGQQLPELSSNKQHEQNGYSHSSSYARDGRDYINGDGIVQRPISNRSLEHHQPQRPISSRSLEHFAYTPQENNKFHAPQLTHVQAAPKLFQRTNTQQNYASRENERFALNNPPPPQTSSRFKPAIANNFSAPFPSSASRTLTTRQQTTMGPPPTPEHVRSKQFVPPRSTSVAQTPVLNGLSNTLALPSADHRQLAPSAMAAAPNHQPSRAAVRRFFPESSNGQPPFNAGLAQDASRASISNTAGQRTLFVPDVGQRGRFG